jgi:hypothetical protein
MFGQSLQVEIISIPSDLIWGICMIDLKELLNCSVAGKCFDAPIFAVKINDQLEIEASALLIACLRFKSTMWCDADRS